MTKNQSQYAVVVTSKCGAAVSVLPGEDFPKGTEIQVTNPYVLGVDSSEEEDDDDEETDGPPPKSGKGSGVRAWRSYAEAHSVDADGLDVDEILAKLEAEGIPVE